MSRIRDVGERERRRVLSNRRDDSPYYDTMNTFFDLAKLFKQDELSDQNTIANSFTNTLSRYYSSYQNTDGTISDENIGRLKEIRLGTDMQ